MKVPSNRFLTTVVCAGAKDATACPDFGTDGNHMVLKKTGGGRKGDGKGKEANQHDSGVVSFSQPHHFRADDVTSPDGRFC